MARRTTHSTLDIIGTTHAGGEPREIHAQASNVVCPAIAARIVKDQWFEKTHQNVYMRLWPWRLPRGIVIGDKLAVRLGCAGNATLGAQYPNVSSIFNQWEALRMMESISPQSYNSAATSRVIGGVQVTQGDINSQWLSTLSHIDVGTTTVGPVHRHPIATYADIATTIGQSYITGAGGSPGNGSWIRIKTGLDAGLYFIDRFHYAEFLGNSSPTWKRFLRNLDGTPFVAKATATNLEGIGALRTAPFNEEGVPANGRGQVVLDGTYNPGDWRGSYLFRLIYEKSGSPTPTNPAQKGSYYFTIRPWIYGNDGNNSPSACDFSISGSGYNATDGYSYGFLNGQSGAFSAGACPGSALDTVNQRYWTCSTNGSIQWWRYKTPEQFHEVVSTLPGANDPIAGLTLGGVFGTPRALDIGSDQSIYVVTYAAGAGSIMRITPDLVGSQVKATDIGCANVVGQAIDRTRTRKGGAGTALVASSNGTLTVSDGNFTQADVEHVIKLTGGDDAGLYRIDVVNGPTEIVVKNLDGSAATFVGTMGDANTFEIGDRIYLFFSDTTSSPVGTITFTDALAWGVKLTRPMGGTPVAGAQFARGSDFAADVPATVDPKTGVLYWASDDVAVQLNRYDPTTNTWSRRLITSFNGVGQGGSGTIVSPISILCIGVNPHADFREMWVGTNQGWVKLNPDDFQGPFWRYYGNGTGATPYSVGGRVKTDAGVLNAYNSMTTTNGRQQHRVRFGIDGRVYGHPHQVGDGGNRHAVITWLDRDADQWVPQTVSFGYDRTLTHAGDFIITPYSEVMFCAPSNAIGGTQNGSMVNWGGITWGVVQTAYQWIDGAWKPKEIVRGALPDDSVTSGLRAKPLHDDLQELLFGLNVKFVPQGVNTEANDEYLGRLGTTGAARTDGAVTNGSAQFAGSGFIATDAGRYMRIHDGAHAGVYKITAYTGPNAVTLAKFDAAWTAGSSEGPLTYSIWEASEGPENATFYAADGFGKDNTQDITNVTAQMHWLKTFAKLYDEPLKFAVPVLGPPGSPGPKLYNEKIGGSNGTAEYGFALPQGRELPALTPDNTPLIGLNDYAFGPTIYDGYFGGLSPNSGTSYKSGVHLSVDFGVETEVGSVVSKWSPNTTSNLLGTQWAGPNGCIVNLHTTNAPAFANVPRFAGGSGLNYVANANTVSLTTGDFLGPVLVDGTAEGARGTTTFASNRFDAPGGTFLEAHVGAALKILTGSDVGSYRILAVAGDGSWCEVRNLDQSAKTWVISATDVSFEVRDSAREDDILVSGSAPTNNNTRVTIERLLTPTTAQIRTYFANALTNSAFNVVKPTWTHVKRGEHQASSETPPDVTNNGTFWSMEGLSDDVTASNGGQLSLKLVMDLSDLPAAKRKGRYWRLSITSRSNSTSSVRAIIASLEFYGTDGKRLDLINYNRVDAVEDPAFYACNVSRIDWQQSCWDAADHVAGVNGLASLGGTGGDIVTLAGGAKFLGHQLRRPGVAGSVTAGGNVFVAGATDPQFTSGDVGRTLRITSGANAGYYRIHIVHTPLSVTLTTPASNAVALAADGAMSWAVHDSIKTTGNDYFVFTPTGPSESNRELTIVEVANDLTWLRVAEKFTGNVTAQQWEIRRRATLARAQDGGWPGNDTVLHDSRGALAFNANDMGPAVNAVATDGAMTEGTDAFTGSGFTADDVGRILVVSGGVGLVTESKIVSGLGTLSGNETIDGGAWKGRVMAGKYAQRHVLTNPAVVHGMALDVTAANPATQWALGIYTDDPATTAPVALVAQTNVVTGVTVGRNTVAFAAPITLAAGTYWVAVITDRDIFVTYTDNGAYFPTGIHEAGYNTGDLPSGGFDATFGTITRNSHRVNLAATMLVNSPAPGNHPDRGAYLIDSYVSPTEVTVKSPYTGDPVSFNAAGAGLAYHVTGERRFRVSRYTYGVRT